MMIFLVWYWPAVGTLTSQLTVCSVRQHIPMYNFSSLWNTAHTALENVCENSVWNSVMKRHQNIYWVSHLFTPLLRCNFKKNQRHIPDFIQIIVSKHVSIKFIESLLFPHTMRTIGYWRLQVMTPAELCYFPTQCARSVTEGYKLWLQLNCFISIISFISSFNCCLEKHSCMSSSFPIDILNGICFFPTVQLQVHNVYLKRKNRNSCALVNLCL